MADRPTTYDAAATLILSTDIIDLMSDIMSAAPDDELPWSILSTVLTGYAPTICLMRHRRGIPRLIRQKPRINAPALIPVRVTSGRAQRIRITGEL